MHIASMISVGGKSPMGHGLKKGHVLYLSGEDDPSHTIKPRIKAMGGNPKRIRVQADYLSLDKKGIGELVQEIETTPPSLIVVDPLFAYVAGSGDVFSPPVIRPFMSQMKQIAEDSDTAILIVRHLTKGKHEKAIYQGGGSMDVIGAARSAIRVDVHPENIDHKIMTHVKHNLSERGESWVYELVKSENSTQPKLNWVGKSELTIDNIMSAGQPQTQSKLEQAVTFLREFLADGAKPVKELERSSIEHGISMRTLERAKKDVGIVTSKKKKGWVWALPETTN